jgi:hypothetical protein
MVELWLKSDYAIKIAENINDYDIVHKSLSKAQKKPL